MNLGSVQGSTVNSLISYINKSHIEGWKIRMRPQLKLIKRIPVTHISHDRELFGHFCSKYDVFFFFSFVFIHDCRVV